MVAEAATLPEYGFDNSGKTTALLVNKGYTERVPTQMGYMTKMASYFCSNIPTELAALSTSLNLSTYPSAASMYWNIAASGPISSDSGPRSRADPRKGTFRVGGGGVVLLLPLLLLDSRRWW